MPPWKNIKLCFGPCDPNLNLDLIDRRKIIFEPVNPIATITTTAYLFLKDGKITGVQDASISADGIDLSAAISPGVRSLLGDAKVLWAHPVESGNRSRAVGSNYLFAALPKAWDTTSTVAAIGFSANGQVELLGNVNLPPQGTTPPTGTIGTTSTAPLPATTVALAATGPTPRVAAAPVLSATERALYLVPRV